MTRRNSVTLVHRRAYNSVTLELDDVEQLATLVYGGNIGGAELNISDDIPLRLPEIFIRMVREEGLPYHFTAEKIWRLMEKAQTEYVNE